MLAFIIWTLIGLVFIGLGILAIKKEEAVGFWANIQKADIENPKAYNRAVGKLWSVFGVVFILLGLPLLTGQNSPWIVITGLGVFAEVICLMIIYTKIEGKYRKIVKR